MKMAKSKLVKANEKVVAFGKIEDTVVGCYTKIEDAFVDRYLAKDGERIEEAEERLKRKREPSK